MAGWTGHPHQLHAVPLYCHVGCTEATFLGTANYRVFREKFTRNMQEISLLTAAFLLIIAYVKFILLLQVFNVFI
jgi:hypothetical protein